MATFTIGKPAFSWKFLKINTCYTLISKLDQSIVPLDLWCRHSTNVTVPEKRDLNEANFILRYKPFKNVCHTETNVNFKRYRTITLDWTGLCSYFKVHSVELIEKKKKMDIPQFS